MQATNTIMMVRPVRFHYNEQTAANNYFQHEMKELRPGEIQSKALGEFDDFVTKLRDHGIEVIVAEDTLQWDTPDSIFPNNWVSFHDDGRVGLYPMYAENRRLERRQDILESLQATHGFEVSSIVDFAPHENDGRFLESTGSMILDRSEKILYAAISSRTHTEVLEEFCQTFGYTSVTFHANQSVEGLRLPIYHTNVMMCLAEGFAVICLDAIDNPDERAKVVESLEKSEKEIIDISENQLNHFAGNMLQVRSSSGQLYLVMSSAAYRSLVDSQVERIKKHCPILHSPLDTIEELGGGSARCMMAEIFLPRKTH